MKKEFGESLDFSSLASDPEKQAKLRRQLQEERPDWNLTDKIYTTPEEKWEKDKHIYKSLLLSLDPVAQFEYLEELRSEGITEEQIEEILEANFRSIDEMLPNNDQNDES